MNFQIAIIWECFAQNPTTQGQFVCESIRAEHLQIDIVAGFRNCGANAMPLGDSHSILLIPSSQISLIFHQDRC